MNKFLIICLIVFAGCSSSTKHQIKEESNIIINETEFEECKGLFNRVDKECYKKKMIESADERIPFAY